MNIEQIWPEWETEKAIGKGSYGTVYKCRNKNDGSYSAIKVISVPQDDYELSVSDTDGLNREQTQDYYKEIVDGFMSEIKILESLKGCKNIVGIEDSKVVEKDDSAGWRIFIRMELLTDFNTYISDKKLNETDVVRLALNLTEALLVCSEKKIIHRDIKPENIFVDAEGNFKLGDFGVAKQLEKTEASLSRKGTYNYMAPEILAAKRYDSRVDIYSLGLVMYKLLNNNRLPFIDPDKQIVRFSERQEAFEKRIRGDKIPPIKNVSDELNGIILKACAFRPEERFKNIPEMKKALYNYSSGKKSEKVRGFISKHKAIPVIAVIIAAIIAGAAVGYPLIKNKAVKAETDTAENTSEVVSQQPKTNMEKTSSSSYPVLKTHFGVEYSAGVNGLYKHTEDGALKLLDRKCQNASVINDLVYYNEITDSESYTLRSYNLKTKSEKEYFKAEKPVRVVYSDENGIYSEDTVFNGLFYYDFRTKQNKEMFPRAYGSTYCCGRIVTVSATSPDTLILYSLENGKTEEISCSEKMNNILNGYILNPVITSGNEVFFTYSLTGSASSSYGTLLLKYNLESGKFESELNLEGDVTIRKLLSEKELLLDDGNGKAYIYNTEIYTLETADFDVSDIKAEENHYFYPFDRQTAFGCTVSYNESDAEITLHKYSDSEEYIVSAPFDNIALDGLHDYYAEYEDSDYNIHTVSYSELEWKPADNK